MVSYVPKRGKAVILLSSMHADDNVSDGGKPDMILFCNSSKGGVDALDQSCATYTSKHRTLRWPLSLCFTFLDIADVNASIVWCEMHPPSAEVSATRDHDRRRQLLMDMGHGLTKPWLQCA